MNLFEIGAILLGLSVFIGMIGMDYRKGDASLIKRLLNPYADVTYLAREISPVLMKYMPSEKHGVYWEKLRWAGSPGKITPEVFVGIKILLAAAGGTIGFLLVMVGLPPIFAVVLGAILFFFPDLLLADRIKRRQWEITYTLPEMMNMISKAVSRGVEFGQAFEVTARVMPGVIGAEMTETWRQMATGRSRREAFKGLSERTGVPTMRRFCDAVISGDERGNDQLSHQLEAMAADAMSALMKAAEEKARQKPSLMLLPIFLFIMGPTLFMILYPQFAMLGKMM